MKIAIVSDEFNENIGVVKEYTDIKDKGMIAQFLVELELIKHDLLELWIEYAEEEDGRKDF